MGAELLELLKQSL